MNKRMNLLLFVIVITLVTGCASVDSQKIVDTECRKVWLLSGVNHTDVMLRMSDLPKDFWSRFEADWIPPTASYVSFGLFNAEYFYDDREGPLLLLPSDAGIWVRFRRDSPELISPIPDVYPLVLDVRSLEAFVDYLKGEIDLDSSGKAIRTDGGSDYITVDISLEHSRIELKSVRQYSAFNTCHSWALGGLRQAGLTRLPRLVMTSNDLLDFLPYRYPRSEQICHGYQSRSSREPTVRAAIIVDRQEGSD